MAKKISKETQAPVLRFGRFQLELEPRTGITAWKKTGLIELEEIVIGDESDLAHDTDYSLHLIIEDHETWCAF